MARRSTARQQAALKSVDYIGSQYAVRSEMKRKDIRQSSFEKREKRIDDMFGFATEALGVIDKWSQKKAEDTKIEKSATSMSGKEGGEISYKKPKIADWIKGDAKFSEIGKEVWNVGGEDYSRADMLAYDKFEQKNKWEDKIGEDMQLKTTYSADQETGEITEVPTRGIDKAKPESKAYTIKGSNEAIEEEYGAGWSYDKQKAINKAPRIAARKAKSDAWRQERADFHAGRAEKAESRRLGRETKRQERIEARTTRATERAETKSGAYDQVMGLAGEPGKDFNKAMLAYEMEYGSTKQTKELRRDRRDFVKENPYMRGGTDEEAKPSRLEDLVTKVKDWHNLRKESKVNVFENITKETGAKSEVGEVLNADTTFSDSDKAYAPKDVGEDAKVSLSDEERSMFARAHGEPSPGEEKKRDPTQTLDEMRKQRNLDWIEKNRLSNIDTAKESYDIVKSQASWMEERFKDVTPYKETPGSAKKVFDEQSTQRGQLLYGEGPVGGDKKVATIHGKQSTQAQIDKAMSDARDNKAGGQTYGSPGAETNLISSDVSFSPQSLGAKGAGKTFKPTSTYEDTPEQNTELFNTFVRGRFQQNEQASKLGYNFTYAQATSGDYDSETRQYGFNEKGDFKGQYTTYDDAGGRLTGQHEGRNLFPSVNLKGLSMKDMWSQLGLEEQFPWANRGSLWDEMQAGGT